MSNHVATIRWTRSGPNFLRGQYSREHTWTFDGGITVPASPSPSVVPTPWSNPNHVDPEEAFVAAIASCHMLTFLWLASKRGWVIDAYDDASVGIMTLNAAKVAWVSRVELNPKITWGSSPPPSPEIIQQLHHDAHHHCFIANSVKTEIIVKDPSVAPQSP